MISHDSVAGHGHVASHAVGMTGGHWTQRRHCSVRKGTRTWCVGISALDIGHWHLHVQCIQRPLDTCRMVTGNGLTLHPSCVEHAFCFACLCWSLASGHCTALAVKTSTVQLAIGNGIGDACCMATHYCDNVLCVLDCHCQLVSTWLAT